MMNTKISSQKSEARSQKSWVAYLLPFTFLPFCLLTLLPLTLSAQPNQFYSIEYSTGLTLGQSSTFINNKYSWQGMSFSGQIFVQDNVAIAFRFGFNNYTSAVEKQVYEIINGSNATRIYADTYRYIRHVPFQIGIAGHLFPKKLVKPYLALFIGANYLSSSLLIQDTQFSKNTYGFELTPELGAFINFSKDSPIAAKISVAYNYGTNHYKIGTVDFKDFQGLNINIGLTYTMQRD